MRARLFIFAPAAQALATVVLAVACGAAAHGQEATEPTLKAAFLYNFARFTIWPPDEVAPGEQLDLCVADRAVFDALSPLVSGKALDGHPVRAIRLSIAGGVTDANAAQLRHCEVLYADDADARTLVQVLRHVADEPVLTVGDRDDFVRLGGMIRFFVDRGHLRFEINQRAAVAASLHLSAQLLKLAVIIKN